MPKYGQRKYNTFKYGRYFAVKPAVDERVKFRLRSDTSGNIISKKHTVDGKFNKVRVRCDSGDFVTLQKVEIDGMFTKVRIRSDKSEWVVFTKVLLESEVGK